MQRIKKRKWFSDLEDLSVPFRKYGCFLPEQRMLLERVHDKLTHTNKPVLVFIAPPASGKTHVICLLARTLSGTNQSTAILVPNNYLKHEFDIAQTEVSGGLPDVDIINFSEYLRDRKRYDFVLADEAHNLKSFLELDTSLTRTVNLTKADPAYADIASRYLSPGRTFVAQQISFASAKDLLRSLASLPKCSTQLRPVTKDPTSWSCFVYIWADSAICSVSFVRADGVCRLKLPTKRLLMFSAFPLSENELEFYCGIPKDAVERAKSISSSAVWREKQRICISLTDSLAPDAKIDLFKSIIRQSNTRILILFNSLRSCQEAFTELRKSLHNVFMIAHGSKDQATYQRFLRRTDGILLTASTVFWEGINIGGLRLVILAEPPIPRPHLLDLRKRKIIDGRIDTIRRLQQGLGRVCRRKGEWGAGVMFFDIDKTCKQYRKTIGVKRLLKLRSWECVLLLHKIFADRSLSIESVSKSDAPEVI
jgi:DNA polymerase III delta prime subunit